MILLERRRRARRRRDARARSTRRRAARGCRALEATWRGRCLRRRARAGRRRRAAPGRLSAEQLGVPAPTDRAARAAASSAARRSGVLAAFDRLAGGPEFDAEDERLHARLRGQRRDGGRDRPVGRGGPRCATASRPPSASAAAGRASCTTRRCRGWAALRVLLVVGGRARATRERSRAAADEAVSQLGARDRRTCAR